MPEPRPDQKERHRRILVAGSLEALLDERDGYEVLKKEAGDPDDEHRLITPDQLQHLLAVREQRHHGTARLGLFFSTDDVLLIPGFMGSTLRDTIGPHGLIWVDPLLILNGDQLSALRLADKDDGPERDANGAVRVEAGGPIPAIYDLMRADLELRRYDVQVFAYDWRKDVEAAAAALANRIASRIGQKPRPLHLVAHSQGSLVARRAVQLLGVDLARRLVNNLVLLGPASYGSYSAAFALAGSHETIAAVRKYGVRVPADFGKVLQSFTGLYQLLPWRPDGQDVGFDTKDTVGRKAFWTGGIDGKRLHFGYGWARRIDSGFFNDRTTIILGDRPTPGAVAFKNGKLAPDGADVPGDGTVADVCALLPGVRSYRANCDHLSLPMNRAVLAALRALLKGDEPRVDRVAFAKEATGNGISRELRALGLSPPARLEEPARQPAGTTRRAAPPKKAKASAVPPRRPLPPTPPCRELRVFSFDPLLATDLDLLDISEITLRVPWELDGKLAAGPVGDYLEVVDYDPASGCFYHPVDLTHPRLAAQGGLPPSESDPQFHQQMVYAVAMSTIATFEKALGRVALWAPRLEYDAAGNLIPVPPEERFVGRLRVYPHALRAANAYYDPDRHALLFGYFPSREQPGGQTLPGGLVFTCLSFDIVAHETTHALLHGLHRYYLYGSNPDVFAFHEAFADAVALFQHFSHTEVVRHQIARTRGRLRHGDLLGQLARQFGQALGHRGALRKYVGVKPDPGLYRTTAEPHDRGAILMAALFGAFLSIYEHRTVDLYRIATGGTGVLPDGDIHPDLADRLAQEAAKSARHLLTMCVRALDYVPPVDLTFGEYLRALITADYDLVRDDDRGYRVSVIDSFRAWGLYPEGVSVLDEAALRWRSPDVRSLETLRTVVKALPFREWKLAADRRAVFLRMEANRAVARRWLFDNARALGDGGESLGLVILDSAYQSVPRNKYGQPKFEIHSIRPCSRIGPDGQQRVDLVAEVVQRRAGYFDPKLQQLVDEAKTPWAFSPGDQDVRKGKGAKRPDAPPPDFWFRGGCTLVIDPDSGEVRYCVRKSTRNDARLARQREFERSGALPSLAATYLGLRGRNPFAMLHAEE